MGKSIRNRREFLRPARAGTALPHLQLLRVGRPAMGSRFEILIPSSYRAKIEVAHRALDEIRRLEKLMTVFSEDSRISEINRLSFRQPVQVEEKELFDLLGLSLDLNRKTGGAFDITAGALWRCWGFRQRKGSVPSADEIRKCLTRVGSEFLILERENRTVRLRKKGVELNLGSIGKGFALDRAAQMLQNAGFEQALLHAGHSSFFAVGGAAAPEEGWKVSVRHPLENDANLITICLKGQGMGTSGIGEQYFEADGHRYGHIIDPRSGQPVAHHLSTTAVAPTAALADALATAFFVMSVEAIRNLCQENPEIGAIVVPRPSGSEPVEVLGFGAALPYVQYAG